MRLRLALLAAPLALPLALAAPAIAQEGPRLEPTRDVAVTYRLIGQGAQGQVGMAWRATGRQARLDNPDGSYVVANLGAGTGFMASDREHELMVLPAPPADAGIPGLVPPGGRFTRQGTDRVAGYDCTEWRVVLSEGGSGRVCVTADGVVLRSVGSTPGQPEQGLEAISVTYAPQSPARFARPAGYREVQPPPEGAAPGGGAPR